MELVAKTHKNIQNKNNEVAKLELDTLSTKLEELSKANQALVGRVTQLQNENKRVHKENDDLKDKNGQLFAGQSSEIEELNKKLKSRDADVKTLNKELTQLQDNYDRV
mmetsp:Transcript_24768/g.21971  ORF Transcript_24768/g.21971 Transcript_24768/m.21971 type:complete len:108 (-) Transcript_24768:198-521(-)